MDSVVISAAVPILFAGAPADKIGQLGLSAVIAAVLILFGAGQIVAHIRAWYDARQVNMDCKERDYRWRQFRRRIQSSAMLVILGAGILAGQWVVNPPWVVLAYWGGVVLLVVWLVLLALADIISTKYYYGRVRQHYMLEEVKLQAELRRLQGIQRNGRANGKAKGRDPETGGHQPDANSEQDN